MQAGLWWIQEAGEPSGYVREAAGCSQGSWRKEIRGALEEKREVL
jgi:hypothetical protein